MKQMELYSKLARMLVTAIAFLLAMVFWWRNDFQQATFFICLAIFYEVSEKK